MANRVEKRRLRRPVFDIGFDPDVGPRPRTLGVKTVVYQLADDRVLGVRIKITGVEIVRQLGLTYIIDRRHNQSPQDRQLKKAPAPKKRP